MPLKSKMIAATGNCTPWKMIYKEEKMKKVKSIIALTLALIMALSFAACGKKGEDSPNKPGETEHPEFVYAAEFKPVSMDTTSSINVYGEGDAGIYVSWSEKIGEEIPEGVTPRYEGEYDVYESRIGIMDMEGNIKQLPNYSPTPKAENTDGKRDFSTWCGIEGVYPMSDGRIMVVEYNSSNWNEAPESVEQYSDGYWEYYKYERNYYIRVLDADGTEISSNIVELDEDSYLSAYRAVLDDDGNLLATNDGGIMAVSPDGSIAYTIETGEDQWIERIITLKDGSMGATTWGDNGMAILPIDLESKKFGDKVDLPRNAYDFFNGGGDYDLYYSSGSNFFGFDVATGESTKILNWLDCDIYGNDMTSLTVGSDGTIVVLLSHWSYNRYLNTSDLGRQSMEIAVVKKVPYESVPQKTVLTLATQYSTYGTVSNAIIKFNRSNDQYRISVKDYSEYNTEDDYSAGMTKLNTEILAGNLPDMILIDSNMPYEQYASKGILEDIYPFIDGDSEIKREDLFPTVLTAMEVNGKLCQAVSTFNITAVMGAKSVVGDTPGWNYDEFNAALASMPDGCEPFEPYVTREDILRTCLALDMEEYVNWTTGECKFDSPDFINLLRFAATFPEEYDYENYDWDTENPVTRIGEGRQMLASASIYSFDDIIYNDRYFGENGATYIGMPTTNGVGNMMSVGNGIAITKDCVDKDGAWQFVRSFLTEKGQEEMYNYGLPTNIKLFNRFLEKEMTTEYQTDAEGNYILDENGERIPISKGGYGMPDGTVIEIYAITQEQADALMELINSTTKLANYNDSIFEIVSEQAKAFFAGQKSPEEVAKLIQSKANIYVNEQR